MKADYEVKVIVKNNYEKIYIYFYKCFKHSFVFQL